MFGLNFVLEELTLYHGRIRTYFGGTVRGTIPDVSSSSEKTKQLLAS